MCDPFSPRAKRQTPRARLPGDERPNRLPSRPAAPPQPLLEATCCLLTAGWWTLARRRGRSGTVLDEPTRCAANGSASAAVPDATRPRNAASCRVLRRCHRLPRPVSLAAATNSPPPLESPATSPRPPSSPPLRATTITAAPSQPLSSPQPASAPPPSPLPPRRSRHPRSRSPCSRSPACEDPGGRYLHNVAVRQSKTSHFHWSIQAARALHNPDVGRSV